MPIEDCPICSKIPATCHRENVDCEVVDDRPPEVLQLETFVKLQHAIDSNSSGQIERCPTCHRLYLHDTRYVAPSFYFDYESTWRRHDVDELFRTDWCVAQRLPERRVWCTIDGLCREHAIVRFADADGWSAVDPANAVTAIDSSAALATLIERDPPRVTGDLDLARRYAGFVDGVVHPGDRWHDSFDAIPLRKPLWAHQQSLIDAARAANRVTPVTVERAGDTVRVQAWVTSSHRLIRRVIAVQPDGRYVHEDTIAAEHLPLATTRRPCFGSLDAFRAFCGVPTMPAERCSLCSNLTDVTDECSSSSVEPEEIQRLEPLVEQILRCPSCHRLYEYSSDSGGGNDIYRGNEYSWSLRRRDADTLFDLRWCVQERVPDRRIDHICPDRFFPKHVLVRIGESSWAALDAANRLVMLDGHDAIAKLVDLDPPNVTDDVELAKRYAIFLDELEHPGDWRPDTFGLFTVICLRSELTPEEARQVEDVEAATGIVPGPTGVLDMRPTAERDGDRVTVRSWVVSQHRLIRRILTVQPTGHVLVEDAVIAEDLPIRGRTRGAR